MENRPETARCVCMYKVGKNTQTGGGMEHKEREKRINQVLVKGQIEVKSRTGAIWGHVMVQAMGGTSFLSALQPSLQSP